MSKKEPRTPEEYREWVANERKDNKRKFLSLFIFINLAFLLTAASSINYVAQAKYGFAAPFIVLSIMNLFNAKRSLDDWKFLNSMLDEFELEVTVYSEMEKHNG